MENNNLYQLITDKKEQLIQVKETLKKEFVG